MPASMEPSPLPTQNGFRLRGNQVSRLETFVDAAFAFAVTLLIISVGTLPRSVEELTQALYRIPAFGVSFALLAMFWVAHNRWSRRYGLEDGTTTFLSLCFIFVTLVFVFPLRMIASGALAFFTQGLLPSEMLLSKLSELQDCFLIYGLGFVTLNAMIWLLYRHALKLADRLQLNEIERIETRRDAMVFLMMAAVGVLSILSTFFVRNVSSALLAGLPGFLYFLTGACQFPIHRHFNGLRRAVEQTSK